MTEPEPYLMGQATWEEALARCLVGDGAAQVALLRDFQESRREVKRLRKLLKGHQKGHQSAQEPA
jgi:hypothetical protein